MNEDRTLRERGIELLLRITAILRIARAYSTSNQVFVKQLEALQTTLKPLHAAGIDIVFVLFEGGLFLNGVRVPTSAGNFRHAQSLTAELERRGIAGFETHGEPSLAEWLAFFETFLDPLVDPGPAIAEALRKRELTHLFVALCAVDEDLEEPGTGPGAGAGGDAAHGASGTRDRGAQGGRRSSRANAARGAAPKRYAASIQGMQSLLTSTTAQDMLEFRQAKRVVQPLIDGIERDDPAVLGLAGMPRRDDFTYARTVNTVLIAITIGNRLGFDRAALSDLAVAALFHGVGRSPETKPEFWGFAGALRITEGTALNRTTLRAVQVALESNEEGAAPRSVMSQIVAIAGTYARLVSTKSDAGRALTPAEALGAVLGPFATRFDPALRTALIEALGFHPPGQFVELDGGDIALVVAPRGDDLARPIVRIVSSPGAPEGERWEGGPLPAERSIVRNLTADETPDLEAA